MHIRALIVGCLLACALAFAPAAMASPPTHEVCILDIAPAHAADVLAAPAPDCAYVTPAVETIVLRMPSGDDDEVASPSMLTPRFPALDMRRQHFDPGRADI